LSSYYGSTLGSNPDIPQKSEMGDKSKEVAITEKYTKKFPNRIPGVGISTLSPAEAFRQ
jgi:hypothetical protein